MFAPRYTPILNTNQQYNIHAQAATTRYAPPPSEYTKTIRSSNTKAAEYAAEKEAKQAWPQNKRHGMLFENYSLELSQDMRPLNLKISSKASSDILSPTIPTSPLPRYLPPPQYSPPRRSKELPREASSEPQRRTSIRPASRAVSPPPTYRKHLEPKVETFDSSEIHSRGKSQSTGRTLPRSKAIETFDCGSIYSLAESHGIDRTPQKLGRLALAASRESPSAKKAFDSHKRQNSKSARSPVEELGAGSGLDDLQNDMLNDILFSVRSSPSARAVVQSAL